MVGLDRPLNPPGADCRTHAAKAILPWIFTYWLARGGTPLLVFVPLCLLACARLKKKKGENPRGGHSSEKRVIRKQIAKVTDFLSFCPFGISIFPFLTIRISMYQKRILPYYNSLLSHPKLLPLWSVPDRRTDNILHPLLPKFFFSPLSARGPTRRHNSTGLAELWGGWPIELGNTIALPHAGER